MCARKRPTPRHYSVKARNLIEAGTAPDDVDLVRFTSAEEASLARLARGSARERKLCLEYLAKSYLENQALFIRLCDFFIRDSRQNIRWRALSLLGYFCETTPDSVWPLVVRWGSVPNRDVRMGVACCILEHLLQYHFGRYFDKAERIVAKGNQRFAYTVAYCYKFGQAQEPQNVKRFDEFVEKHRQRRGPRGLSRAARLGFLMVRSMRA